MVLAFLVGLVIGAWCRLKGWVWLLATGAGYKGCKLPLSGSWILSGKKDNEARPPICTILLASP